MITLTENRPALMTVATLGPTPNRNPVVAATRSAGPLSLANVAAETSATATGLTPPRPSPRGKPPCCQRACMAPIRP